jgi:SAM-dependent methyltransferase
VLRAEPRSVLDVGCGEGWLTRALADAGCRAVGVDASAALVAAARERSEARYFVSTYREMTGLAEAHCAPFDVAVCNFSLLEADLAPVFAAIGDALRDQGRLIVQTVHPWIACGDAPYADGWRVETFANFGAGFDAPMPWYFRTLGSWIEALEGAGFRVERIEEPCDRETGKPLSLLITARASVPASR